MAGKEKEVKEVETKSMDELLGTSAAVSMTPEDDPSANVFKSTAPDTSVFDKATSPKSDDDPDDDDDPDNLDIDGGNGDPNDNSDDDNPDNGGNPDDDSNSDKNKELGDILDKDLDDDGEEGEDDDGEPKGKGGRKPALVEAMSKLVESEDLRLFEGKEDISEYTTDEIVELVQANIENRVGEVAQKAPMDLFSKLDPKLQEVVAYNLQGGQDITSVLKNVTRTQEVSKLDPSKEEDAERIAREWLTETKFGTPEEIEEEIVAYRDRNELDKKANQFKPKLDKKEAEILQKRIDDQNKRLEQEEEQKANYAKTIFDTLNKPDLNGLPLDNKVQTSLYNGITDTSTYQDSKGNPTNELGHLIQEYQTNPQANKGVLLEALWLLKNPSSYRERVLSLGEQKSKKDTRRELKVAESKRATVSSSKQGKDDGPGKKRTVKRKQNPGNIFSRPNN